jgi:dihydrofolate reductase
MIMQREILERLAREQGDPCVTISLNTHRTHPDNATDGLMIKNLCKEAAERLTEKYGRKAVATLIDKLAQIPAQIDVNYNLDSLHIFLSEKINEIIKSTWPATRNHVHIGKTFAVRPLIKAFNRSEEYYILLLSQSGTQLYMALNDAIVEEIEEEGFPFPENPNIIVSREKMSDGKQVDKMVKEYLNNVDKAVVRLHNKSGLNCVVISTESNYSKLMQVADKPKVYHGYANIDYNNTSRHKIAAQSWRLISELQKNRRTAAIDEMKEAVSQSKVLTDLQEIFRAAKEGRGDLLITHQSFAQPVMMKDEVTFELVDNPGTPGAIDDIVSNIAWEVVSKKGRAVFTEQDELKSLGKIALKLRY